MNYTQKQTDTIVQYLEHKRRNFQSALEYWSAQIVNPTTQEDKRDPAWMQNNVIHFTGMIGELDSMILNLKMDAAIANIRISVFDVVGGFQLSASVGDAKFSRTYTGMKLSEAKREFNHYIKG